MIRTFPGLLDGDLKDLPRILKFHATDLSEDDARAIVSLFPDLHLPGLITLLCVGTTSRTAEASMTPFPLTEAHIAEALTRVPDHGAAPREETIRAARLLMTDQFFGDMADAVATVSHTVPGLPLDIAEDLRSLPSLPQDLLIAIERDLSNDPTTITAVVRNLQHNGRIDSQPTLLVNTYKVIVRQATAKKVSSTLRTLLGNESVRLAIMVYARSKGIQISEQDLEQVRAMIGSEEPNIGALLERGYLHLMKQFGKDHAMELLGQLVSSVETTD